MSMRQGFLGLAVLLAALASLGGAPSNRTRPYSLADLAWLEGTWRGAGANAAGDTTIDEEHWGAAIGESRLGWFRAVRGEAVRFYEFQVMRTEPLGVKLFIKHYSRDLSGWEPRDSSTVYALTSATPTEARFTNPRDDEYQHMTYRLAGDSLHIRLEGVNRATGRDVDFAFGFARVGDAAGARAPERVPAKPEHPE